MIVMDNRFSAGMRKWNLRFGITSRCNIRCQYVASKAALQPSRFPDYDIHEWRECAVDVPLMSPRSADMLLSELGYDLYVGLGLKRLRMSRRWLNRVAIEMLYGLLVPRLLDGPGSVYRSLTLRSFFSARHCRQKK
jgi:hypothetical protein